MLRLDLPEVQLFAGELFFNDTSRFDSRSQHILLSRHVVWLADSLQFIEVAEVGTREGSHYMLKWLHLVFEMKSHWNIQVKLKATTGPPHTSS